MSAPRKPRAPKATAEPAVLPVVKTNRLEICDQFGDVRLIVGIVENANQPGIVLYDRNLRERVAIGFDVDSNALVQVNDKFGKPLRNISSETPEEVI
jgi:hypothetical protein